MISRSRVLQQITDPEFSSSVTHYAAAATNRINSWFQPGGESADAALLPELAVLRQKSRDLFRNNANAAAIINALVTNVVGIGILPQSRLPYDLLGITKEDARLLQRDMETNFKDHSRSMDFEGRLNFRRMQRLAFRQQMESGEYLAIRRYLDPSRRRWARYGTCWQIIEPDQLCTPHDRWGDTSIRGGVEMDRYGSPVAYWIAREHPGDVAAMYTLRSEAFDRIPAYDQDGRPQVLHKYDVFRPRQSRGVPILSAIVEELLTTKQYWTNESIAAVAAACLTYFITSADPYGDAEAAGISTQTTDSTTGRDSVSVLERTEPGMIARLERGDTITPFMPGRPNANIKDFMGMGLQQASGAIGLPYEATSHNWRETTYTSGRMSLLDAWPVYDGFRLDLSEDFLQPTWEMSIEEQAIRGDIPPMTDWPLSRARWGRCQWVAPARRWVDPLKEVKALEAELKLGINTRANVCAQRGEDWEEVDEQRQEERMRDLDNRKAEQDYAESIGLQLDPRNDNQSGVDETDPQQQQDDGDNQNG